MRALTVSLGRRTYPVLIGRGLLNSPHALAEFLPGRQVLIVTNEVVAPLWLRHVRRSLDGLEVASVVLPDGEQTKTLETLADVFDVLAEHGFHRDCTVLALGGGVVGDLAGFAAACWHRGVACVQAPTTLLAQVDAAIGGKTAVNVTAGKNLVGAFHQPLCVLADIATLSTLGEREFRAGLGEVIKYGVGLDADLFEWLEEALPALLERDPATLEEAVYWCCALKSGIVARDERESEGGQRALLNLGHSFAHAIESATGYGGWLHGEAVAAGLVMASRLAVELGTLDGADAGRVEALVAAAGLPVAPPPVGSGLLREYMHRDKKIIAGRLRLVLPLGLGRSALRDDVPEPLLDACLAAADPR